MEDFKEKLFKTVFKDKEEPIYVIEKKDWSKYLFEDETEAQNFIDECKKKNEYKAWYMITSERYE